MPRGGGGAACLKLGCAGPARPPWCSPPARALPRSRCHPPVVLPLGAPALPLTHPPTLLPPQIRGKATGERAGDLMDVARDVLLSARLDDRERFRQMVLETKAGLEAGVVGSGHSFAASRLDAQRSVAGWASEAMGGVAYLEYIRSLAARLDQPGGWEGVQADLESIRGTLLQRKNALVRRQGRGEGGGGLHCRPPPPPHRGQTRTPPPRPRSRST